jgi:hypothetical protein
MPAEPRVVVATRELLFSPKGERVRHKMTVRIYLPVDVQEEDVSFEVDPGTACCRVELDGLHEPAQLVYGADTLQALSLAVDIDPLLRGLSTRYDFFFPTGEEYFDE